MYHTTHTDLFSCDRTYNRKEELDYLRSQETGNQDAGDRWSLVHEQNFSGTCMTKVNMNSTSSLEYVSIKHPLEPPIDAKVTGPHISTCSARRTVRSPSVTKAIYTRTSASLHDETHGVMSSNSLCWKPCMCEPRFPTWQDRGRSPGNSSILSAWGRPLGCCWLPKTPVRGSLSQDAR